MATSDQRASEVQALISLTVQFRARLRDSAAQVADLLDGVTKDLAKNDATAERRAALLRQQRELWALRDLHAKGMRQAAFTLHEIADTLGVSLTMARKIVTRGA